MSQAHRKMISVATERKKIFSKEKFPIFEIGKNFFKVDAVWIKVDDCTITLLMCVDYSRGAYMLFDGFGIGKFGEIGTLFFHIVEERVQGMVFMYAH